jgi:ActR/RegA family two-component response regulator
MKAMSDTRREVVRVLIVDDEEIWRKFFGRQFVCRDEFEFVVETASSKKEYDDLIRDGKKYHVLTVDIRLLNREEGIDDVITYHRMVSPETIIVAFSGFPNMDKVQTCVRAMKAGADNCFEKNVPDFDQSISNVTDYVVKELQRRRDGRSPLDQAWLEAELNGLIERYPGQVVAIQGHSVIASGNDSGEVREQLAGIGPEKVRSVVLFDVPAGR